MFKGSWVNGNDEGVARLQALRAACGLAADEIDPMALHIAVEDEGGLCATGRMYPQKMGWRIDQIAVPADCRGKGYGELVLRMLLWRATEVYADADIFAAVPAAKQPFYERFGFRATEQASGGTVEMAVNGAQVDLSGECCK